MGSKSPEQDLAEFLAAQPLWLRKVLQLDYPISPQDLAEMNKVNWPEVHGEAQDAYLKLLARCPAKLRDYRKRKKKQGAESAVADVPDLPLGAPRKNWLADECRKLQEAGMSQPEIARELNLRYPDLKDRKGNPRPITEEVVRKRLASLRKKSPDKT